MSLLSDLGKKLIEQTPLALIVIGLLLFILGLNGGWKRFEIDFNTPVSKLAIIVMGLIVCGGGAWLLYWREKAESRKGQAGQFENPTRQATDLMKIDGQYHTESHHYRIFIIPLPKDSYEERYLNVDYYRIYHADWEGVGFFDNEFFYTAFQINDKATQPDRRGNWGVQIMRWNAKDKSFEVSGIELNKKNYAERELKKKRYDAQLKAGELTQEDYDDRLKKLELNYAELPGDWIWERPL
jgi:hypothetical protein